MEGSSVYLSMNLSKYKKASCGWCGSSSYHLVQAFSQQLILCCYLADSSWILRVSFKALALIFNKLHPPSLLLEYLDVRVGVEIFLCSRWQPPCSERVAAYTYGVDLIFLTELNLQDLSHFSVVPEYSFLVSLFNCGTR